jgi:hypothetical protein
MVELASAVGVLVTASVSLRPGVHGRHPHKAHQVVLRHAAAASAAAVEMAGAESGSALMAAGRVRGLTRHKPDNGWHAMGVLCAFCSVGEARVKWPCEDYRDFADGLVDGLDRIRPVNT